MLTGARIQSLRLVENGLPSGFRATSYDVRIAQIVTNDGALHGSYKIPRQGIVQVISAERLRIPLNVTGIATVKTTLCNEGLLALNIGIIDPGYEGLISSFLVNFSNEARLLSHGEPFLRLQFQEMANPVPGPGFKEADADYRRFRQKVAPQFGSTFLNLSEEVEKAAKDEFVRWRTGILAAAGTAALILGVLTFLLNWGSLQLVKGWLQPADTVRAELFRGELHDQIGQLVKANAELKDQLKALESRLTAPQPPAQTPAK
jgi:deoxycytidine triphosphate deaminase